jgi:phage-related protein
MKRWQVEFFEDERAGQPVKAWVDGLPEEVRGRVLARIDLLAQHGPTLDYPYTSQIEGRLREVRLRFGKTRYRVLYFFDDKRVAVLLHAFTKDTEAVEEANKSVARRRMASHIARARRKPGEAGRKKN